MSVDRSSEAHRVPALTGAEPRTPPTWSTAREAAQLVCAPRNLWRTGLTAAVVGVLLFAINQLDVVLAGHASAVTWVKIGLTFLVPFCVANAGMLMGSHLSQSRRAGPAE